MAQPAILVLEDDEIIRALMVDVLEDFGAHVTSFPSADEGMIYLNLLDECTNPDQDCEVIVELDNEAIETLIQGLQAARAMRDMYRRENP